MAEYTTNYELKKPGDDDFYDVKDFNDNADIIDQALKAHDDALATKETPAGAQAKAEAAAGAVQAELDAHKTENASTSQKGHVQLSTSTTSTSTSLAATASAVKTVNDALTSHKAAAAPHSGHETPAGAQAKAEAAATAAVAAHEDDPDPHEQYALEADLADLQEEVNAHKAENRYGWAQGVNDLVITTGAGFQYVEGAIIRFGASNTNTGAVTLNVNGKGVRPLRNPVGYAELPPGRLKQYQYYEAIYNGSHDCFFIKTNVELDRIPVPSGADMNDYITPGNYPVLDTATAATLLNYPATDGGILEVLRYTPTFFIQRLTTSTTGVFYQRVYANGVWSNWNMTYNTTNITVSTSAPVSALAEGFQHQVY
ncbi:MAG: pyocin knob domain-containing protein [Syntrophomonadaceae bacterium]|jgi:hypothetical protein